MTQFDLSPTGVGPRAGDRGADRHGRVLDGLQPLTAPRTCWARPGDHVFVRRQLCGVPYRHHGIVVQRTGADRGATPAANGLPVVPAELLTEVVHYVDPVVARSDWSTFADGQEIFLAAATELLHPDDVVSRAERHVGCSEYTAATNNCEHFARWCSTGHWRSTQVEAVRSYVIRGGMIPCLAPFVVPLYSPTGAVLGAVLGTAGVVAFDASTRRPRNCDRCTCPHDRMEKTDGTSRYRSAVARRHEQAVADLLDLPITTAPHGPAHARPQALNLTT